MTDIVLVHGGAHGAWCWERLTPHLRASPRVGEIVTVDLRGRGARADRTPLDEVTLDDWVDDLVDDIESRDLRDVLLVGHSLAGITIPPAAARVADRLRRIVYLSTTNPALGSTAADVMQDPRSPMARGVDFETMFCSDLDEEATAWLMGNLGAEAPGPFNEPAQVVGAPPGVPSTYVILLRDEALPPDLQRDQAATAEVDEVVGLDAGHSAFASRPRELATLLLGYCGP